MTHKLLILTLLIASLVACSPAVPATAPILPTATPVPPTATSAPTATAAPSPTKTPAPTLASTPTPLLTPPSASLHVLFIGNSHIFTNNLPEMFANLAQSGNHQVHVDASAIGGYTLEQHTTDSRTLKKIAGTRWDFVILQESTGMSPAETEWSQRLIPAARALDKTIKGARAQTILFMTWASASTYAKGGFDGFADEQAQAATQFLALARELDAPLAPVGLAWENVLRERPELELWQSDQVHATRAGTYLMACVFYAVIFQQSPDSLSYTADLPEDTARFLQRIAMETVLPQAASTASPLVDSGGRRIAFYSERDGNGEIYALNLDDGSLQRLTDHPASDGFPAWSPDGKQIAFVSQRDDHAEIYLMNADGSAVRRLTHTPAEKGFLTWSPDGKQIAFESNPGGNWDIYVVDLQGSNLHRLTDHPAEDYIPVWSPDGLRIAFESERDRNWEIYVMRADGTDQRRLTRHIAHDGFPSWSPDGKKIAFMSDRESNPEIYVMNADGSNLQRLTDNAGDDTDPDWSPDGTRIVFVSNRDGNDELYLMNADGSDPRRLTYEKANDWQPAWRPALPRK